MRLLKQTDQEEIVGWNAPLASSVNIKLNSKWPGTTARPPRSATAGCVRTTVARCRTWRTPPPFSICPRCSAVSCLYMVRMRWFRFLLSQATPERLIGRKGNPTFLYVWFDLPNNVRRVLGNTKNEPRLLNERDQSSAEHYSSLFWTCPAHFSTILETSLQVTSFCCLITVHVSGLCVIFIITNENPCIWFQLTSFWTESVILWFRVVPTTSPSRVRATFARPFFKLTALN